MKKIVFLLSLISCLNNSFGQGFNHQWLLGTGNWANVGRIYFDSTSYIYQIETRKIRFNDTQGNICDANGNFLMSSNGVWISNANNDTLMNGAGLNPSSFTSAWSDGLPIANGNIFLPFPGDTSKYILFHQTGDSLNYVPSTELFYSIIDMNLDGGLGGVTSQKNVIIFHDTISWGLGACKHANGRDWWVIGLKDNSDLIYKILLTPNGITNVYTQHLGVAPFVFGNVTQPTFSPDGSKFTYTTAHKPSTIWLHDIRVFDFDRCSGQFSNPHIINLDDTHPGVGVAFSPNSEFIYATSSQHVFQINVNTLFVDTVATYDGFCYPNPPWCSLFDLMYLAANGKIYIGSANGVQHIHEMNSPDSAGIACNLQQHSLNLNGIWNFRTVPNHPNYYLGCDTMSGCPCLATSINENAVYDFRFRIYPNPISNSTLHIGYLLPKNKSGTFQIYDITGKVLVKYNLPQWSNEQSFTLPELSNGVYSCVINSSGYRVNKILIVLK